MTLSSVMAQTITITGKLIDRENDEPLIFASVGVKGQPYGTVSNSMGEFDFHIDASMQNATLAISMLGYENKEIPIASIRKDARVTIRLKKVPRVLDEVVITEFLSAKEVITVAINRIPINFPEHPFLLDGFYRDIKRVNGVYISLLEAAIQIFDRDYSVPRNPFKLKEKVGLIEIRKSLGYNHKYIQYFDQGNLLEQMLINNNIRYHDFPDKTDSLGPVQREKSTIYNNQLVHVISYVFGATKMRFYIDKTTYGIVRLEYESDVDENIVNPNEKYKDYINRFAKINKTMEFKYYRGKYYLNYMTFYKRNQWYHRSRRRLDYDVELYQELLINNIHHRAEHRISPSNKMRKYGLQYQDQPYNKEFWDDYNVIKNTPLNDKIIQDLEQSGSLEHQFKGN